MQPGCVTVMMPAYNAEKYIGEAIESVLAQSYANWELIIVDDGSKDRTAEIASQFTDSRIKVIQQANGGEAAARNTALTYGQGEFLAFLDSDDVYLSHHLEVTVGFLQSHEDCDGVYTDGYYCDQNGTCLQALSSRRRGPFEGRLFEEVVRGPDVFGPPLCVVLRQDIISGNSLRFDTNIVIGPDWDFFTQYAAEARFGYIDHITCLYRVHQSNITARVDLQRRALEMAKCRKNAVKMNHFQNCSVETRSAVFYDLLVDLLRRYPNQQIEILRWPEFNGLPLKEQARLLRLMASKALVYEGDHANTAEWLRRARALDPEDQRGTLFYLVYRISPSLCKRLLRTKARRQVDPLNIPPLSDLKKAHSLQHPPIQHK